MDTEIQKTLQKELYDYFSSTDKQKKSLSSHLQEYRQYLSAGGNIYQDLAMLHAEAEIHYDVTVSAKDAVHLHSHAFCEILFCNGGNVDYLLGSDRYHIARGDILLIPPGVSHRPLFTEDFKENYERFALWLDAGFLNNAVQNYEDLQYAFAQCEKQGNYLLRTPPSTWEGLLTAFRSLWQETQHKRLGWQLCVSAGALVLLAHINRTYYYWDTTSPPVKSNGLVDEIFRYIDVNLSQKLTLEGIANHFFVSKSTVSHLFSEQMGVSFYRCVIQRRLIASKNHILQGMPLRQVWEACGFSDYTSFYRLFKKEYHISPQEFRTVYGVKTHVSDLNTQSPLFVPQPADEV